MTFYQVTADRRQPGQGPSRGAVDPRGTSFAIVGKEHRPRVFARAQKDRVGVVQGLFRERGDVQPAERNVYAFFSIVIGDRVCPSRGSDVHLNNHQSGGRTI